MPIGKLVFAQLMDFLPLHTFRRCVARYPSNYPTKTFSHLDQYLSMTFAQLTFRESLRDIEVCLRAHEAKLYHLGIRGHVARSNLGDANEKRDWRIYRDFANSLIAQARRLYADDAFAVDPLLHRRQAQRNQRRANGAGDEIDIEALGQVPRCAVNHPRPNRCSFLSTAAGGRLRSHMRPTRDSRVNM